jgi:hypothetical protein
VNGVDWSQPIEAVHEDGRVVAVEMSGSPDKRRDVVTTPDLDGVVGIWHADGSPWSVSYPKRAAMASWRIRNVAQAQQTPHPAPSPSEVGPDVVERMIALVRRLSGGFYMHGVNEDGISYGEAVVEAQQIVALLPESVDALEEAQTTLDVFLAGYAGEPDEALFNRLGHSDDLLTWGHMRTILRALEKEAGR